MYQRIQVNKIEQNIPREVLTVTVIPLEAHLNPYEVTVAVNH